MEDYVKQKRPEMKVLIFDLGKVLVDYDVNRAVRRFSAVCGISPVKLWKHLYFSPKERAYTRGEISSVQFYQYLQGIFRRPVSFKKFKHYWTDIFWEIQGMDTLLGRLARRYPLYLISNTNPLHFDYVKRNFGILRHFKKTFPSHKMGARKPEARIYRRALARIGCKPGEAVFIDDMKSFVRGARKIGMQAIRFRNRPQLIRDLRKLGIRISSDKLTPKI